MDRRLSFVLTLCLALTLSSAFAAAFPSTQTPALAADEAQTVYLINLQRRARGVGPLRANRQLTEAARWFSWDSVENQPAGFCGHTDSQGHSSEFRAQQFGYPGRAGAENAYCGYVTPSDAVSGWMNSPGHRANLLNGDWQETGLGYYQRSSDGRGYITQMFGADPNFAPAIINDEAPATSAPQVSVYTYNRTAGDTFAAIGPSQEMRLSSTPCFAGIAWQPYATERSFALAAGTGWREVYVQTRDALDRTAIASDAIYLGSAAPPEQLSLDQTTTTASSVKLYNLNGGAFSHAQISPGWIVDDSYTHFEALSGPGGRVNDPDALGGSALRLGPGAPSTGWAWTTDFVKDAPLVAYFRLKVDDNTSSGEIASFTVDGGGTTYGPLKLHGTDFTAAGVYQDFALPFTFNSNPNNVFLIFNFARSGATALSIDAISIYTPPQPLNGTTQTWPFPGGHYRGQGIQLRYTDAAGHFSAPVEAQTTPNGILLDSNAQSLLAERNGATHPQATVGLAASCLGGAALQASASASWLHPRISGGQLLLLADQSGLADGTYTATATVSAPGASGVVPAQVTVTLRVAEHVSITYVPRS